MKSVFVLFLISFSLVSFSQNKKDKKDIKANKIKSVTETVTDYAGGKESSRKDSYTLYNKNADVIINEEYKKDGTLKHKEVNKYDSNGNKTEEVVYDAADNTPKPEKTVKHVSKYDINDNKTEESEYDASGKLISKTQYSYNAKGDRTTELVFDSDGKQTKKVTYSYDSKGMKTEKKEFDASGNLLSLRKYQYEF
jgi:hypothetical protein